MLQELDISKGGRGVALYLDKSIIQTEINENKQNQALETEHIEHTHETDHLVRLKSK